MSNKNNLQKIKDIDGLNWIVKSNLTSFELKSEPCNFSIKYVSEGVEYYNIDEKEYQVKNNNFIISHPNQQIEVYIDSPTNVIGICYYFDANLVQQIVHATHSTVKDNLNCIDSKENFIANSIYNIPINEYCTRLNHRLQIVNLDDLDKLQISKYLMLLAEDMVCHQQHTQLQLQELNSVKSTTKKELYKRIQTGRQFIHDNISHDIFLKEMAKAACLSEYYFHRSFRHFFNLTPHEYHHTLRMQLAHQLINQGKHSKKEIALRCGFEDAKYFSKTYKKWKHKDIASS